MTDDQSPDPDQLTTRDQSPDLDQPTTRDQSPDPNQPTTRENLQSASRALRQGPLHRSANDRLISGVAGGIGAYFQIDPVIVRIGLIVLTFMGGAGLFLYLIGWLALPRENSGGSIITDALGGNSPHRLRSFLTVVLIGGGLLITASLSSDLFALFLDMWTIAPLLALVLIATGIALVFWPESARRPPRHISSPPQTATSPLPGSHNADTAETDPTASPTSEAATPATPSWADPALATSPAPVSAENADMSAKNPEPHAHESPSPLPRSVVGALTIATLLVLTGGSVLLDRLDLVDVDIAVFLAVALAVTGAGLLVSAFTVPARGLILLGSVLAVTLIPFAGSDASWSLGSGIGSRHVIIGDAAELESQYSHSIGQLIVDLRDFQPDGAVHELDVDLAIGEVLVYAPDDITTIAEVDIGVGSIGESHRGSTIRRIRFLSDGRFRILLEDLLARRYEGEEEFDDVQDYLDAYRELRWGPDRSETNRSETNRWGSSRFDPIWEDAILQNWPADLIYQGSSADPRDILNDLLLEARDAATHPTQFSDRRHEGPWLSRRITMPPTAEPADTAEPTGELRLDIDIGMGHVEVVNSWGPQPPD